MQSHLTRGSTRTRGDVGKLYNQLCSQINHLTYDRTDDDGRKIGARERKQLLDLIHDEVARLANELRPGYAPDCLRINSLAAAAAMEIKEGATEASTEPRIVQAPTTTVPSIVTAPGRVR